MRKLLTFADLRVDGVELHDDVVFDTSTGLEVETRHTERKSSVGDTFDDSVRLAFEQW